MQVRFCFSAVCNKLFCLLLKYLGDRRMDLCQIHREDVFGPLLGRVWMSSSKVRATRDKIGKLLRHPHWQCIVRRAPYVQITWSSSRRDHCVTAGGWRVDRSAHCRRLACCLFNKTSLALIWFHLTNSTVHALLYAIGDTRWHHPANVYRDRSIHTVWLTLSVFIFCTFISEIHKQITSKHHRLLLPKNVTKNSSSLTK